MHLGHLREVKEVSTCPVFTNHSHRTQAWHSQSTDQDAPSGRGGAGESLYPILNSSKAGGLS